MWRHEGDHLRTWFMSGLRILAVITLLCLHVAGPANAADQLRVGSKRFTESYILGEIIAGTAQGSRDIAVEHKPGLGNTAILFQALKSGAIDLYPDYTGTIALELLGLDRVPPLEEISRRLADSGLAVGVPLGFGNSYALAVRSEQAERLKLTRISELSRVPGMRYGLSPEFLNRKDGWPTLQKEYGLNAIAPGLLEHGLAYDALRQGRVDVIDVYTTDARLVSTDIRILEDDRRHFPEYRAVLVYRADLPERLPLTWSTLKRLESSIPPSAMQQMNAAVELQGLSYVAVAGRWLAQETGTTSPRSSLWSVMFSPELPRLALQHLALVGASLLLSVALGIPLGVVAQRKPQAGPWVLGLTGLFQTIPSLALLAFLVAALGRIGAVPAILALFLYSLLPIVRSTETALNGISIGMRDAASALGLDARQRMLLIEMPLAAPGILSGIKTAAIINVGTATVAAFIGAGGLGERIVAGLAINDHNLLLAGAIPAAILALLVEWGFRIIDRLVLPSSAATSKAA